MVQIVWSVAFSIFYAGVLAFALHAEPVAVAVDAQPEPRYDVRTEQRLANAIAKRARVPPALVWDLRQTGLSWPKVAALYGFAFEAPAAAQEPLKEAPARKKRPLTRVPADPIPAASPPAERQTLTPLSSPLENPPAASLPLTPEVSTAPTAPAASTQAVVAASTGTQIEISTGSVLIRN